jgi:hypothetical protein
LKEAGLTPPPAVLVRGSDEYRSREPHEVWQMDAVEGLKLKDGSGACWLRISDEYTGAILATFVFPEYRWAKVPALATQEALRQALSQWGRPQVVRVDNGIPWGRPGGLPSALSLWLAGLAVRMHWNDPYTPQQNGVVESTQGVSQRWVAPSNCADLEDLRRRVQREDYVQREEYPAIDGRSRRQAYPSLCHSGRGYARGCEALLWDLQEALGFLSGYQVRRKVSKRGQVSAYHRLIQVGSEHGGCWVYLGLDAQTAEWVIRDVPGQEMRRRPAPEFTAEAVMTLAVARP